MMLPDPILSSLRIHIHCACCSGLDSSWSGRNHIDDMARLYYVEAGEAYVRHHGREYRLWPGGMYLVPAHTQMDFWCPRHFVQHWVHFNATIFGGLDLFWHLPCAYETGVDDASVTAAKFGRMEKLQESTGPANILESAGILLQLLAPFLVEADSDLLIQRQRAFARFREVLEYIESHLAQPVSTADLARVAHMERTYFCHLFSRQMGISPARYVRQRRIQEAQTLLIATGSSLDEIADRLCFSDAFHLSKAFKQATGISPSRFRRTPRGQP